MVSLFYVINRLLLRDFFQFVKVIQKLKLLAIPISFFFCFNNFINLKGIKAHVLPPLCNQIFYQFQSYRNSYNSQCALSIILHNTQSPDIQQNIHFAE